MTRTVQGRFEVKPQPQEDALSEVGIQRLSIDKTFEGPLTATSRGQMLSFVSETRGSAGYVAMERVTGTLEGKRGSFTFQHSGKMDRGSPSLELVVVADSGTEELTGLSGSATIEVVEGVHRYTLTYSLPELP